MKNNKFLVDILLIIILTMLMLINITGLLLHEIIGLIALVIILIHLLLNFTWIKNISKNFSNINFKTKTNYILNCSIFLGYLLTIITGIVISKYLFDSSAIHSHIWSDIHHISAYISFILTILHIILHFKHLKGYMNKLALKKKYSNRRFNLFNLIIRKYYYFKKIFTI